MGDAQVSLYYKNITADVIGTEHGVSGEQLQELAEKTAPLVSQLNRARHDRQLPYMDLPYNDLMLEQVKRLAVELSDECENFVVLGIGGSALGNIALQTALNPYMHNLDDSQRKGPRLFVFDNVDPVQLTSFLNWVDDKLDKTIFNVISKSGSTAETASQYLILYKLLCDRIGRDRCKRQIVATTDAKEGTLRKIANEEGFRTLDVPDGVGGRFSVLSAVGLLSAAVCGIDVESLLAGAREMDKKTGCEDFYRNPAAINAAVNWHYYNRGKKISVMMPYSYALKDIADWYRQLWAESLGKAQNLAGEDVFVGPTPVKALGATDQHSQVQLYREGPNDKLFTFLEVSRFQEDVEIGPAPDYAGELDYLAGAKMSKLINSEKYATEYSLLQSRRPCLSVIFDKIDAYTVGQFIYLFEVTTSLAGLLFGINAYDQPAVELGKEATFGLMGRKDYAELAEKIKPVTKIDEHFLV